MFLKSRGGRANKQIITILGGDASVKNYRVGHLTLPWGGWVWE